MINSKEEFPLRNMPEFLYNAILQSINDPFNIIDKNYRVLWVNSDDNKNGIIGNICYEIFLKKNRPCRICPVKTVLSTGNACVMEKWFPMRDAQDLCYEVRAYPVYNETGNLHCVVKIGHDITDKKLELEKQRRYVESLEKSLEDITKKESGFETEKNDFETGLTGREHEVLRLLSKGFTNTKIAKILSISPHTVKSHVIHIFNKIGVNDRTQAAVWAARVNLI